MAYDKRPGQSLAEPLSLPSLARYTLLIGPLTPGELHPYPLPHLAHWLTPVDTPKGFLYTAHPRVLRLLYGKTRPYAATTLARQLERRQAYEYLVAKGAIPYLTPEGVYLQTPSGLSYPLGQLRLGRRERGPTLPQGKVLAWWRGLGQKPITLPLEVPEPSFDPKPLP